MTSNKESLYWKTNENWYRKNKDGQYELTEKAPQRAKDSFILYLEQKAIFSKILLFLLTNISPDDII